MEETAIVEASENDENRKKKNDNKKVVGSVVDAIGACVTPMLPIITAAAIIELIASLLDQAC